MCVVLVFNSIDLLKEVADPIYLQSKQRKKFKGGLTAEREDGNSPPPSPPPPLHLRTTQLRHEKISKGCFHLLGFSLWEEKVNQRPDSPVGYHQEAQKLMGTAMLVPPLTTADS